MSPAVISDAPLRDQLMQDPNPVVQAQLPSAVPLALAASAFFVVVESSQALLRVLDRPGSFVVLSLTATLGGPLLGLALVVQDHSPERYLIGLIAATPPQRPWALSCACGAVSADGSAAIPARPCEWD